MFSELHILHALLAKFLKFESRSENCAKILMQFYMRIEGALTSPKLCLGYERDAEDFCPNFTSENTNSVIIILAIIEAN